MKVDVLILAGGRNKGPLQKYSSAKHEALIKIGNMPMVEYVIKAVVEAECTDKVAVIGPRQKIEEKVGQSLDLIIDSGESMIENIQKGMKKLNTDHEVLVITCDIPLIRKEVIDQFINLCQDKKADIYYPIISKEANQTKFPGVKRTYVQLKEGTFTGGNMVLIKPEVISDALSWLEKAILWRKKPWKLSQLLGPKIIFKFIIGSLSLSEIENRVTKILGHRGVGMVIEYPEVGFDVDKPSDLRLIRDEYLAAE